MTNNNSKSDFPPKVRIISPYSPPRTLELLRFAKKIDDEATEILGRKIKPREKIDWDAEIKRYKKQLNNK